MSSLIVRSSMKQPLGLRRLAGGQAQAPVYQDSLAETVTRNASCHPWLPPDQLEKGHMGT